MHLFEALRESHEKQRQWCRQLARSAKRSPSEREALFLQLKVELEAHAAAEERFLYVPLLLTDPGLSASRHALAEHHQIEELCEELSVRDKSGADWLATAAELSKKVHHHLREEETKFFQVGGRILSETRKATLARQYLKDLVRMRRKGAEDYRLVQVGAAGEVMAAPRSRR